MSELVRTFLFVDRYVYIKCSIKFSVLVLAMGSLDGGKVALYRSIPIITVDVTAEVKGTNVKVCDVKP